MEDDVFTLTDFFLISLLSFLIWVLGRLRGQFCGGDGDEDEGPHKGRRFEWRYSGEGSQENVEIWQ